MRLHEFTDPTKYLLPPSDAADLLKQSKNIATAASTNIADRQVRKKPETEKSTDTL